MSMIATFCAFGQNDTIKNSDSVYIPKHWLREGKKDILRGDNYKQELDLIKPQLSKYKIKVEVLEKVNTELEKRNKDLEFRNNECINTAYLIEQQNSERIKTLTKQLRRSKNGIKIGGGITLSLLTAYAIKQIFFK